jgi:lipid-binding SYLF domain-containing protein
MKKFLLLSLVALFGASLAHAAKTRADYVVRIETCEAILQEFQANRAYAIPPHVWRRARGVLIVNQLKAGFVIGVQSGFGVLMVKKADGRWSLPVLVNASEASLGFQIGAKTVEGIYIITDDATPRLLFNQRFHVGVDAKAVAGPRAAEAERFNHEILKTPLLVYTKTVGLFAGATVKAGQLVRDDKANFALYNTRYTMPELLYSDWVTPPADVQPLMALVQRLSP